MGFVSTYGGWEFLTLLKLDKFEKALKLNSSTPLNVTMCTLDIVSRLNLYLDSQLIYIVGFEFPIMGSPFARKPNYTLLFLQTPLSFLKELLPFSLDMATLSLSLLCFLFPPAMPTPQTSHPILPFIVGGKWTCYGYFLISLVWMGVQFHRF